MSETLVHPESIEQYSSKNVSFVYLNEYSHYSVEIVQIVSKMKFSCITWCC